MRVLFYEDPVIEKNDFAFRLNHVRLDAGVYEYLKKSGWDVRFVVGKQHVTTANYSGISRGDLFVVDTDELLGRFPDPALRHNLLFQNFGNASKRRKARLGESPQPQGPTAERYYAYCQSVIDEFKEFFSFQMEEFSPDIIVTWVPVPHLEALYPRARILHKEASFLNFPPCPWTHYYDVKGFHNLGWIKSNENLGSVVNDEEIYVLGKFEKWFEELCIYESRGLREKIQSFIRPREATVLFVSQRNHYYLFDSTCHYRSQGDILSRIIEEVGEKISILVTEHPDPHGGFSQNEKKFLSERHENVMFVNDCVEGNVRSHSLFPFCDLIVAGGSNVGLQALMLRKKLVTLADCHFSKFADGQSIEDLGGVISRPSMDENSKRLFIAWYLIHFTIVNTMWQEKDFATRIHTRFLVEENPYTKPFVSPDEFLRLMIGDG